MGLSTRLERLLGDCSSCNTRVIRLPTPPKPLGACARSPILPMTIYNERDGRPDQFVWWFPWTKNKWSNLERACC